MGSRSSEDASRVQGVGRAWEAGGRRVALLSARCSASTSAQFWSDIGPLPAAPGMCHRFVMAQTEPKALGRV